MAQAKPQRKVRSRRSYSEEFKQEAVQLLLDGHSAPSAATAGPAAGSCDIFPSGGVVDGIYARKFGGVHPGVCHFVFCDGSVRAIRTTIDGQSLHRYAVRNDGDAINSDD